MPILDAALAFALTMLVVASAVTQILNWIRNTAKLRNRVLHTMLDTFLSQELQPVLRRELVRGKDRLSEAVAKKLEGAASKLTTAQLFTSDELDRLVEVSTGEMIERLKRSKLGEDALAEMGDEADRAFTELATRYEALGERVSDSFRTNSKRWAHGVALALALVVNIDCLQLIKGYLQSGRVTATVLADLETAVGRYENQLPTAGGVGTSGGTADRTETDKAAEGGAANTESNPWSPAIAAGQEMRERIENLENAGVPFGWSYFPYNGISSKTRDAFKAESTPYRWFLWVVGIWLTSYLAALGAPFWYDTVSGISKFARAARQATGGVTTAQREVEGGKAPDAPSPPAGSSSSQ